MASVTSEVNRFNYPTDGQRPTVRLRPTTGKNVRQRLWKGVSLASGTVSKRPTNSIMNRKSARRHSETLPKPHTPIAVVDQERELTEARQRAELRKLHAESSKMEAEAAKLHAESRVMPWVQGLGAGVAAVVALFTLWRNWPS